MSRRIEIHLAPWGKVRLETWINGRRTSISEAISPAAARFKVEALEGTTTSVIDHTRQGDICER